MGETATGAAPAGDPRARRTRNAALGAATTVLQFALQALLQALLYPVLLRVAGAPALGAWSMLQQVLGYLALSDLGFGVALSRGLAQSAAGGASGARFQQLVAAGRTLMTASGALYALLCLALVPLVGSSQLQLPLAAQVDARRALVVLAVWSVVRGPASIGLTSLQASQRLAALNLLGVAAAAVRFACSIGFTLLGWGLLGLVLASMAAESVSLIGAHLLVRQPAGARPAFLVPSRQLLRELSSVGLRALGMGLSVKVVYATDSLVVGTLHGAAMAGAYYTTQIPALFGASALWALQDNAMPGVNDLIGRGDESRLREAVLQLLLFTYVLALPFGAGVLLFNRDLVSAWVGPAMYAGDLVTWSLGGFAALAVAQHLQTSLLQALGDLRVVVWLLAGEGLVNLGLSIGLGRALGPGGVMLASLLATVPTVLWVFFRLLRRFRVGPGEAWTRLLRPALAVVGCATLAGLAGRALSPLPWLSLGGFLACGGAMALVVSGPVLRSRARAVLAGGGRGAN